MHKTVTSYFYINCIIIYCSLLVEISFLKILLLFLYLILTLKTIPLNTKCPIYILCNFFLLGSISLISFLRNFFSLFTLNTFFLLYGVSQSPAYYKSLMFMVKSNRSRTFAFKNITINIYIEVYVMVNSSYTDIY